MGWNSDWGIQPYYKLGRQWQNDQRLILVQCGYLSIPSKFNVYKWHLKWPKFFILCHYLRSTLLSLIYDIQTSPNSKINCLCSARINFSPNSFKLKLQWHLSILFIYRIRSIVNCRISHLLLPKKKLSTTVLANQKVNSQMYRE